MTTALPFPANIADAFSPAQVKVVALNDEGHVSVVCVLADSTSERDTALNLLMDHRAVSEAAPLSQWAH